MHEYGAAQTNITQKMDLVVTWLSASSLKRVEGRNYEMEILKAYRFQSFQLYIRTWIAYICRHVVETNIPYFDRRISKSSSMQ